MINQPNAFKGTWKYRPLLGLSRKREIDLAHFRRHRDSLPFDQLHWGYIEISDMVCALALGDKNGRLYIMGVLTQDEYKEYLDPNRNIVEILLKLDDSYVIQFNKPVALFELSITELLAQKSAHKISDISLELLTRLNCIVEDSMSRSILRNKLDTVTNGLSSLAIQLKILERNS